MIEGSKVRETCTFGIWVFSERDLVSNLENYLFVIQTFLCRKNN
ncbi:hypothetical protein DSOL_4679 [Desulfosporosinus metallidurans]|uniref:Uncharacterized protein n=1 Tax=Desulfosporosinus metallidurans TaxID=1888891 RepID=A0A1Q8QIJ5_9FIRM|nr:hypothetical protein DSOL_4679 [Desulfosporosinus metallidurans]